MEKIAFALKIMWKQPIGAWDSWSFLFFMLNSTLPCLWMWGNTLQKCQGITHSVGLVSCKRRWVYRRIDVHYFLERERKHMLVKKQLQLTLRPHNSRKNEQIQTCNRAAMVPQECQSIGARSGTDSRFLLSSSKAFSLVSGLDNSLIHW